MSEFLNALVSAELSLLGAAKREQPRRTARTEQIRLRVASTDLDFFRSGFREVHYRVGPA